MGVTAEETKDCLQLQLRTRLLHCPPTHLIQESVELENGEQLQRLKELLNRALRLGESNSALVVGPRGVGKTAAMRVALSQYTSCPDAGGSPLTLAEEPSAVGLLVRLNGLVHTDDKLALRDITRQLRLEDSAATRQFRSFAENLSFLLSSLQEAGKGQSIVFVLEEFDLFCHHHNQTLLYNLFDVAQSAQNPICVLGLTCRLDAVELLEKRVRSRFSHRQIHLQPPALRGYTDIARRLLMLPVQQGQDKRLVREWNKSVASVLQEEATETALQLLHSVTRDLATLRHLLLICVSEVCTSGSEVVTATMVERGVALLLANATPTLLQGLSTLQLALVIAMMHLSLSYEGDGFTFELVHSEYLKFIRRRSSIQGFERPVVFKAFDHLRCLELVTPLDGPGSRSSVQKEYQLMRLQLPPKLLQDSINKIPNLPTDLLQWAASALA